MKITSKPSSKRALSRSLNDSSLFEAEENKSDVENTKGEQIEPR